MQIEASIISQSFHPKTVTESVTVDNYSITFSKIRINLIYFDWTDSRLIVNYFIPLYVDTWGIDGQI